MSKRLGYRRYWVAEHHNMEGIASAATSVVIGHIASHTSDDPRGRGRHHAAEPCAARHRRAVRNARCAVSRAGIDLGLGRAPGTDRATLRALRRDAMAAETFPEDVLELQALLAPPEPGRTIRAVPGAGSNVPLWILGSSLYGAQLAALLGLPYAFASHFAPDALEQAIAIYRERFQPSAQLSRVHAMAGVNVIVADTDDEARRLFTSIQMRFVGMFRGDRGLLQPPIDDIETYWSPMEKVQASRMLACSFVGAPATVEASLNAFVARTGLDELIVACAVYDPAARLPLL